MPPKPSASHEPITRVECSANTGRIVAIVSDLKGSVEKLSSEIGAQRKDIKDQWKDIATIRESELKHRAWHNGQEHAEGKAAKAGDRKATKAGLTVRSLATISTIIALIVAATVYLVTRGPNNDQKVLVAEIVKAVIAAQKGQ